MRPGPVSSQRQGATLGRLAHLADGLLGTAHQLRHLCIVFLPGTATFVCQSTRENDFDSKGAKAPPTSSGHWRRAATLRTPRPFGASVTPSHWRSSRRPPVRVVLGVESRYMVMRPPRRRRSLYSVHGQTLPATTTNSEFFAGQLAAYFSGPSSLANTYPCNVRSSLVEVRGKLLVPRPVHWLPSRLPAHTVKDTLVLREHSTGIVCRNPFKGSVLVPCL